tara:strand:+ start:4476 stop:4895 length:420 start_codon:yes stop_codon:yes gene_type:complete
MNNNWLSICSIIIPCGIALKTISSYICNLEVIKTICSDIDIKIKSLCSEGDIKNNSTYKMADYEEEKNYYLDTPIIDNNNNNNNRNNNNRNNNNEKRKLYCLKCNNRINDYNIIYVYLDNYFCTTNCRNKYINIMEQKK